MHRWTFLLTVTLVVTCLTRLSADEPAADEPEFNAPQITVPEGFTVELAAAPPLVRHPMMAGFDERGRLFIAESAGMNLPRAELEKQLPNFIRMLEDTDGDGRFDKSTIFADKMTFPMGAVWYRGALYVASSGAIWRLEDTDDDGVADRREKLVTEFGYTGNAADVHGCFLGPDGRIYWCEGRHGHDIETTDGSLSSKGKAARIFSCRPDGSDVQIHCGGGMDNPVEIDFTDEGEMLGTVNLFYKDRGDCLVHWMHGGAYPRYDQEAVVAEFKRTGDLLTEVFDLGHVAVSGTTRYRGSHFGLDIRDNFFVTEFNTHKVVRLALARDGSTFRADKHEFLSSESIDFHPTDVLEDADGSLLVIDTGGWFRIGCPTSQIAKPNILGAIYRVRRTDRSSPADPRGREIDWKTATHERLAELLTDTRPVVREQAIDELAARGDAALDALEKSLLDRRAEARRNAVWVLTRNGSDEARSLVRVMLTDRDPSVRQTAVYSVGITGDDDAETFERLSQIVIGDEIPEVRREAATALGRLRAGVAVPALLAALRSDADRVLEHALIYALIEIGARDRTLAGLADASPRVRRAALIACDQMHGGNLTREFVAPLLDTDDIALQKAALDVIGRHEGWGDEIVALLERLLAQETISSDQQAMVRGALIAFAGEDSIQQLVAKTLAGENTAPAVSALVLEVIARSDVAPLPQSWVEQLDKSLHSENELVLRQAVGTVSAVRANERFFPRLLEISGDEKKPEDLRVTSLAIVAQRGSPLDDALFELLARQLNDDVSPMQRLTAARALGAAETTPKQKLILTSSIAKAGPLELSPLLAAFSTNDAEIGRQLIVALAEAPGLTSLSEAQLGEAIAKLSPAVQAAAKPLVAKLRTTTQEQQDRLAELDGKINGGNVQRGRDVFHSRKTSCFACHRIGEEGGRVGPDLTTIGQRRSQRDLLEAILFPSSSLARGFETHTITTVDGRVLNAMIVREGAVSLHLRTPQQEEIELRRADIEEMIPNRTSIMPAGLDQTMTVEQLNDLVAYLQSLK